MLWVCPHDVVDVCVVLSLRVLGSETCNYLTVSRGSNALVWMHGPGLVLSPVLGFSGLGVKFGLKFGLADPCRRRLPSFVFGHM